MQTIKMKTGKGVFIFKDKEDRTEIWEEGRHVIDCTSLKTALLYLQATRGIWKSIPAQSEQG